MLMLTAGDMLLGLKRLVRLSARLCELLRKPFLLASCALYACRAAYMSSIICFSFMQPPLDTMSNKFLDSVYVCTGIGCLETNYIYLRIASASSNKSAKAITSADITERVTHCDLYDS